MGDKTKPIVLSSASSGTVTIQCRQLSFATAKQTRRAFHHVCQKLKCVNPFRHDSVIVDRMQYYQREYMVRAPTGTYDPLDYIPKAFEAIDSLPWCALKKVTNLYGWCF
jgi:hypothetical protein